MAVPDDPLLRLKRRHQRELRRARAEALILGVASMLRPGDVAVDCGAHWGEVTAVLAATGATVHAFEPDPLNLERLQARFAGAANVHLHAAAVGVAAGTARFHRFPGWQADPARALAKGTVMDGHPQMAGAEEIMVPVIDFPAFLRDQAKAGEIALVKLDIEGAELAILQAMRDAGLFDRVRLTLAETHARLFPALAPRYQALRDDLAAAYPVTRVNLDWI